VKFSRKQSLAATVVMGVGVIGAALFGTGAPASYAASSVVTVSNPPMTSLDPTQWAGQILVDQGTVLEGLYGYNQQNQIVPKIATHYTVTNGGKTWTFFLRHDAKWSNGQPVTANDFYYSWMRLLSPSDSTGAIWASIVQFAANGWSYHFNGATKSQVGIKVINPYEIQITESAPHNLIGVSVLSGSMPLYAPSVNAHPSNWFMPQYFVGDGPYVVKSFVPNGAISFVRNPKYVGAKGEVNVGNVQQINLIPAPTVPVEDYLANKMDVATITSASDYQYVISHAALKSQLHIQSANGIFYLEYDKSTTASPVDNLLVRQAIAMAINRPPIATAVLNNMSGAAYAFGSPSFAPTQYEQGLPYNVAKARALLAKAGYPNGKGIPTLALYCQIQSVNPQAVSEAEAIQQELKQALNINFQIDPTAATQYGNITWGGLNEGVKPGYNIGSGVANWLDPSQLTMQADQEVLFAGTQGPAWYREHISNWYFPKYDPDSLAKYGNPDDAKLGVSWTDWLPLQKAVASDNAYLTSWWAKQPSWYHALNIPLPGSSTLDLWNNIVTTWKTAKSAADKHTAWVNAWKFVGNYSAGNGGTTVGLDGQVYVDKHQPAEVLAWKQLQAKLGSSSSIQAANKIAGQLDTSLMQSGYVVPITFTENIFLAKPNVTNVQTNPFSWNNFYQLQYLSVK